MKQLVSCRLWSLVWIMVAVHCHADDRLNILWITAEDMSPTLGCYGDEYAKTPNIDRLAKQSTRYDHAFATAPVCSPSRSCLITGCYATSLGTHQMRSAFPIPDFIRGFPAYLREAGYYTSNNFKTDYNTSSADRVIAESWDESSETAHWRKQPQGDGIQKPFFSVFNLMTSHQSRSMVWTQDRFRSEVQAKLSQADVHDPDKAPIPSYYPDTLVTRRIVARYYDCVTAMDDEVGSILSQLEKDGLDDDTIVFFYSDHGSGMPRHKRLLHDSGMHVPLLVRFPKKWAHLAPTQPGQTTDRIVSFVDFPPTVLKLVGIEPPEYMQGMPFLGEGSETERKYAFGHRDRIDEVIDCSRSVRDKQYLYIHNFMPHLSWNQYSAYSDLSEIRHELYYLAERRDGTQAQMHYAGASKPAVELYDCLADPENKTNLASRQFREQHREKIEELRLAMTNHLVDSLDLGFIPEIEARKLSTDSTSWEAVRNDPNIDSAWITGSVTALSGNDLTTGGSAAIKSDKSASERYWGAVAFSRHGARSTQLRTLLTDPAAAVRIEAAHALASQSWDFSPGASEKAKARILQRRKEDRQLALPVLIKELDSQDLTTALYASRAIELLGDSALEAVPAMKRLAMRSAKLTAADTPAVFNQSGDRDLAMFCSFSANGFLNRLREGPWIDLLATDQRKAWANVNDAVKFSPNAAEVTMLSKGKNLWLVHETEFADFELSAEVSMPADDYNAGIGFRCELQPNGKPKGYQCEIAEEKSGMLYAIASGGWVWPKGKEQQEEFAEHVGNAFRSGHWNHFRIRCDGPKIQIWVNGILATDLLDETHRSGRIALQHHGKGGLHRYRNVRLRAIAAIELPSSQ